MDYKYFLNLIYKSHNWIGLTEDEAINSVNKLFHNNLGIKFIIPDTKMTHLYKESPNMVVFTMKDNFIEDGYIEITENNLNKHLMQIIDSNNWIGLTETEVKNQINKLFYGFVTFNYFDYDIETYNCINCKFTDKKVSQIDFCGSNN